MFFVKQGLSKVDIKFEKDSYYANERAVILCDVDNSHCEKDIKEIKIKVRRTILCHATSDAKHFEDSVLIIS